MYVFQNLDNWLKRCMFSSASAVRAATCRLLTALCFITKPDGTADLGSPVDIALVLERLV